MVKIEHIGDEELIMAPDDHAARLITRHVRIGRRRTTCRLAAWTWDALGKIAREQNRTLNELCTDIAGVTAPTASFAAAARCYVLGHISDQIPDEQLPAELLNIRRHGLTLH
jgi:predicted DNA-binding ribbon-helix-helix protein